jgi:CheY-like chemotaxis protein
MAKLVITSKSHAGLSHLLGNQWVTIGRGLSNAFQIPDSSISGQHCEVLLNGSELLVRDMRSTNGTFIKGKMITEGVLRIGEVLQLGEIELRLEASQPSVASLSVHGPAHDNLRKAAATSSLPSNRTNGAKKHQVLLVDDSMAFLETSSEMFGSFANGDWEIHKACGADQALSIIQQRRIEVAVLDLNMPMLDGVQLLGMLHRRHPEVKKVVLTGLANESLRTQCLATGAELFLEKPITRDGMRFVFNVLNDLITWKQRDGFAGTLQQVGLTDIIQIECLRRSSCILEVHAPQSQGEIYIESGVIIHAATAELSGEKALHRLLCLTNGQFHLYPYRQPSARTIQGSWEWLVMESARVRDEERSSAADDKTAVITRSAIEVNAAAAGNPPVPSDPASSKIKPPANTDETDLTELGNGIVVVSTYDGKWNPVDGEK